MNTLGAALLMLSAGVLPAPVASASAGSNQVLGTWRMLSAQEGAVGRGAPLYGKHPSGLLVFTSDMHFVEVLTNADIPKFASNARAGGTAKENKAAMAGSIGFFGTYTVDGDGAFSGNRVEGATFPNWVGDVRTRRDLQLDVVGDGMTERFRRPDGTHVRIVWRHVR